MGIVHHGPQTSPLSSTFLMDYATNITFVPLLPTTMKHSLCHLSRSQGLLPYMAIYIPQGDGGFIHFIHQYNKGRGLDLHLGSSIGSEETCSTRTDVVWHVDFALRNIFGLGYMLSPFDALLK
jgi:hypothetical protein